MSDESPPAPVQRCPHCAASLAPPGRFCTSCGRAVDHGPGPRASRVNDAPAADAGDPAGAAAPVLAGASARSTASGAPASAPAARRTERALPPASGRGASRACTSCGAVNARARELCLVCGLDLDPTDRTAVPPRTRPSADEPGPRGVRRGRVVSVVVALTAVIVVMVAITIGLALAELGPFAVEDAPLPPVAFPAGRYPQLPESLELSGVATLTSAPPAGDRVFSPDRMVDGDPTTAWRAAAPSRPADTDETVDVLLAAPAWVTSLVISNGDHHDATAYEASGRVQRAALRFDGDVLVGATLLDLGRQRQLIALDTPVLTTAVRLSLVEVLPGVRSQDPALSSIEVRGHAADAADSALAQDRAAERPAAGPLVTSTPGPTRPVLPWARDAQGS